MMRCFILLILCPLLLIAEPGEGKGIPKGTSQLRPSMAKLRFNEFNGAKVV